MRRTAWIGMARRTPLRQQQRRRYSSSGVEAEMKAGGSKVMVDWLSPTHARLLDNVVYDMLVGRDDGGGDAQRQNDGDRKQERQETQNYGDNKQEKRQQSSPATKLGAAIENGPLPQGYHLVYFPLETPTSRLARDGADADHVPPCMRRDGANADYVPSYREGDGESREGEREGGQGGGAEWQRLWAGGSVEFRPGWQDRMRLDGRRVVCEEEVQRVRVAERGGSRAYVHVARRYGSGSAWDIAEKRVLAFVPRPDGEVRGQGRRGGEVATAHLACPLIPRPLHLFQFSALSYNAHSIHYDGLAARVTERHPAPLVQGPLALVLMLRLLAAVSSPACHSSSAPASPACLMSSEPSSPNRPSSAPAPTPTSPACPSPTPSALARTGHVAKLTYRNYAPLYADRPMCVRAAPARGAWAVWIEDQGGNVAVEGTAVLDEDAPR